MLLALACIFQKWSYSDQYTELQLKAPTFSKVLETAVNMEKAGKPLAARKQRGLVAGAGVLLQTRSKFTNAAGVHTALIMKRGGASAKTFKRLNDKGLSVSYKKTLDVQKELGAEHNAKAKQWAREMFVDRIKEKELEQRIEDGDEDAGNDLDQHREMMNPGFKVLGDNADIGQKARQLSKTHKNPDHHFFNHCAIKNRVNSNHLNYAKAQDASNIEPAILLPSVEDNNCLREELVMITAQVMAKYIPALAWFAMHVPKRINHEFASISSSKSEVVSYLDLLCF